MDVSIVWMHQHNSSSSWRSASESEAVDGTDGDALLVDGAGALDEVEDGLRTVLIVLSFPVFG